MHPRISLAVRRHLALYAEDQGHCKPACRSGQQRFGGSEGDPLRKEAYALLKAAGQAGHINFVGNVEGRDVPLGACDVAVCDGFAGNVMLKTIEGVAKFMAGAIDTSLPQTWAPKSPPASGLQEGHG